MRRSRCLCAHFSKIKLSSVTREASCPSQWFAPASCLISVLYIPRELVCNQLFVINLQLEPQENLHNLKTIPIGRYRRNTVSIPTPPSPLHRIVTGIYAIKNLSRSDQERIPDPNNEGDFNTRLARFP